VLLREAAKNVSDLICRFAPLSKPALSGGGFVLDRDEVCRINTVLLLMLPHLAHCIAIRIVGDPLLALYPMLTFIAFGPPGERELAELLVGRTTGYRMHRVDHDMDVTVLFVCQSAFKRDPFLGLIGVE
jgi:hypothetical protein